MAHILRLSVLFVLFVHSVHAMEQKDDILEALHKSGHQTITRCDIQPMTGRGSNTKSLHTIYLKWELLVCKELRDNKESTNLQALDPFVQSYHEKVKDSSAMELYCPISFARFKGTLQDKK